MVQEAASGQGLVRFWAFTPAMDLLKLHFQAAEKRRETEEKENETSDASQGPVTVLLLGLADVHHILWTVQARDTESLKVAEVHFILAEELPESAARALLLLHILTDESLSVRERVALYIDVYANAFVKEQTALLTHSSSSSNSNSSKQLSKIRGTSINSKLASRNRSNRSSSSSDCSGSSSIGEPASDRALAASATALEGQQ
ncbi:hypothetical protein Emag_004753 [Eimeria magna]